MSILKYVNDEQRSVRWNGTMPQRATDLPSAFSVTRSSRVFRHTPHSFLETRRNPRWQTVYSQVLDP